MEHISLTIFSICVQAAIGITIFVAIGRLVFKDKVFKNAMIVASGISVIGMIFSLLHLGHPLKAMYALLQFGSSWLSREIWFTAIFVGLTVLSTLIVLLKPEMKKLSNVLIYLTAIVGLIDVFVMASIYSTTSVSFWQGSATYFEFYAATISMGAACFLLLSMKESREMTKLLDVAITSVIIVQVVTVTLHLINAGTSSQPAMAGSLVILMSMPIINALKWILLLAGTVLFVWLSTKELSKTVIRNAVVFSGCFIVFGQIIGRYLFYAAMIAPGIGLL